MTFGFELADGLGFEPKTALRLYSISSAEAARILKVSTRRVHQFIDEGRLEAEKIGRDVFIRRPSVEVLKRQPRRPGRPKKER